MTVLLFEQDQDNTRVLVQVILKFLPLMIGWFSLNLPSGLGLYYFANTVLTTAQQIWLRKLGGILSVLTSTQTLLHISVRQ